MSSEKDLAMALGELVSVMDLGKAKYPRGATLLALVDEVGEVVHAVNKSEGDARVREEVLQVAAVAMRIYLGDIDPTPTSGLRQAR